MSTGPLARLADVTPFHVCVTARAGLSECDRNQHLCLPSGKLISDVIPKALKRYPTSVLGAYFGTSWSYNSVCQHVTLDSYTPQTILIYLLTH